MRFLAFLTPLWQTAKSVLPLVAVLIFFQGVVFRRPFGDIKLIFWGMLLTLVGLHLFLKGISLCLVPLGEMVGTNLFRLGHPVFILLAGFVIGFVATLVEPALRDMAMQVEEISVGVISHKVLLYVVATGFGLGMALGLWRLLHGYRFLWLILPLLGLLLIGVMLCPSPYRALALDTASATTGPVNIPVNMAIALGLASVLEGLDPLTAGFGLVGVTSCCASLAVLVLGLLARIL